MSEADFSDIFDAMSKGYLEHHGVKGMKWGVRRTPEQLGHVKKSRKSRSGYFLDQAYDRDITMPAGSVSYRVQAHPKIRTDKPLYVSYDKSDHIANIATAMNNPDYGVASDYDIENGNLYSISIKAKKPLKAPSYYHAMETFVEMVGEKRVNVINPYSQNSARGQDFIKSWKARGTQEYGAIRAYTLFVDNLRLDRNRKIYNEFTDRLINKGYNSLVDPADFSGSSMKKSSNGEEVFRKAPMIILKPNSDLLDVKVDKLSKEDLKYLGRYDLDYGDVDYEDRLINKNPLRISDDTRKTHEKWKKWYHQ